MTESNFSPLSATPAPMRNGDGCLEDDGQLRKTGVNDPRYLYLLHYRDDFGSKQVERLQVVDILKAEDSLVDAQGRE